MFEQLNDLRLHQLIIMCFVLPRGGVSNLEVLMSTVRHNSKTNNSKEPKPRLDSTRLDSSLGWIPASANCSPERLGPQALVQAPHPCICPVCVTCMLCTGNQRKESFTIMGITGDAGLRAPAGCPAGAPLVPLGRTPAAAPPPACSSS
jgi:hypothetical protein